MIQDIDYTNFSAGELSPRLKGRVDLTKYFDGCESLLNLVVMPQGGATRRPGTLYVANNADQSDPARLIPFEFSEEQAYVIEMGAALARFYADDGLVLDGGTPVEIATPYGAGDLGALDYTQSADTLYLTSPSYPTQQLTRSSNVDWSIGACNFLDGPYLDVNGSGTTLTVSGTTGAITVTASSTYNINGTQGFLATDVGRHIRIKLSGIWAWGVITAVSSTTVISVTLQPAVGNGAFNMLDGAPWAASTLFYTGFICANGGNYYACAQGGYSASSGGPTGTGANITDGECVWNYYAAGSPGGTTPSWQLGKWCATTGFPYHAMFWQNRLVLAGTNNEPNAIECSVTGDFYVFSPTQGDGSVTDINALSWVISDDQVNAIRWLSPAGSAQAMQLGIGTSGGEDILQASATSEALTPSNVQAYRETSLGSAPGVRPLRIIKSVLFANRSGRKVHEWTFQWQVNGYLGPDLAVLAEHITRSGIVWMDYQQSPYGVVWCVLANGGLIGLTYLREQDVVAWHHHQLGGQYYGGPPRVESLCVIPSPDESYDEVWLTVLRTINGTPTRTVEVMTRYFDAMPADQSWFLDCAIATTLTTPDATAQCWGFTNQADSTQPPALGGDGTLTTNAAAFSTSSVGQLVRINGGRLLVTEYLTAESVAVTAQQPMTSLAPAASGAWSISPLSTSFSGLGYLAGETVGLLGDGMDLGTVTAAGTVAVPAPGASYVVAGLPAPASLITMPAEPMRAAQASASGRIKRIDTLYLRFLDTLGGTFGMRLRDPLTAVETNRIEDIVTRTAGDAMNQAPPLFTGSRRVKTPGGYDQEARIVIEQNEPLPLTILAIGARADVMETGPMQ